MLILAIETSCDETSVALVENGTQVHAHALASSARQHVQTGGIVPEVGARQQIRDIIPLLKEVLRQTTPDKIDAIAVTVGPGLIGSLLIGVETAKALAWAWDKPLIPVDHVIAHLYAPWINENIQNEPTLPVLGLVVSGGHTELILLKNHGEVEFLGGTRDDAAGEAFDKVARLLGLPYPGGPAIEKLAQEGNPTAVDLPRPMIKEDTLEMSFSGLKTAVRSLLDAPVRPLQPQDVAASFQQSVIDVLIAKTRQATERYHPESLIIAGGVAANQTLAQQFHAAFDSQLNVFISPLKLSVDNAAMIGSYAYFNNNPSNIFDIVADPNYHAKSLGTSRNLKL